MKAAAGPYTLSSPSFLPPSAIVADDLLLRRSGDSSGGGADLNQLTKVNMRRLRSFVV
jgi:hypothetical protein